MDEQTIKNQIEFNKFIEEKLEMNNKETNSQVIKQILELCEAFYMPEEVVKIVKNKCWKLTKNTSEDKQNSDRIKNVDFMK